MRKAGARFKFIWIAITIAAFFISQGSVVLIRAVSVPPFRSESDGVGESPAIQIVEDRSLNADEGLFRWALAWWKNNTIVCNIYNEFTGEPSREKIKTDCGEEILKTWLNTPACTPNSKGSTEKCNGLYLVFLGMVDPKEMINPSTSPKLSLNSDFMNCAPWQPCTGNPQMQFYIQDEIPRVQTHKIVVLIGEKKIECASQPCIIDMPITKVEGVEVSYWVEPSPGYMLYKHTFKMRNLLLSKENNLHIFDVVGEDWPSPVDACANTWNLFPETEIYGARWLEKVFSTDSLKTDLDYALLAGRLIWHGYVDASGCPDSGLLANGAADECGMTQAYPLVLEWQNRFNQVILRASDETRIPARLIKGVIAQESQFWPLWQDRPEYGYGMMSEMGIDLLLNWNTQFYLDLCNEHYTSDECQLGYSNLPLEKRRFLQGVCLLSVGTDDEFILLANMLKASCGQTRQLVENVTRKKAGEVLSYENLWRMSLGLYTVGSGCIGEGLTRAWSAKQKEITWEDFSRHLPAYCEPARTYFDKVVYYGSTGLH